MMAQNKLYSNHGINNGKGGIEVTHKCANASRAQKSENCHSGL